MTGAQDLRSQLLELRAAQGAKVVHSSKVLFNGNLEPDNLCAARRHADEFGIPVEIGIKSICQTTKDV